MTYTVKNMEAARDAIVARAKELPKHISELQSRVQTLVKDINLADIKTLPEKVAVRVKAIDLSAIDTAASKAFAPINLTQLQARTKELQERLVEIPALIQGFVTELPEVTTKLVTETTAKAKTISDSVSIFGFSVRKPATKPAAKKTATKKPVATKPAAKKTATKPVAKKTATKMPVAKKSTPTVPPVVISAPTNGNGVASTDLGSML